MFDLTWTMVMLFIYHIPAKMSAFSQNIILPNLMEKLESVQYFLLLWL